MGALGHADQIDPVPDLVSRPAREYGAENPRSAQSPLAVFEHPHGRFVHAGDPLK